jgi:hypothetical protein
MDNEQITHNFTNHPPQSDDIATKLDDLTTEFVIMAKMLNRNLPEGREKALALTNLEQCSMWSKAAVARNQEG